MVGDAKISENYLGYSVPLRPPQVEHWLQVNKKNNFYLKITEREIQTKPTEW
jgi:hypothetical protein